MKWLCFGAGAIGTYLGGSLALAGEDLTFLEQPTALGDLRLKGLSLDLRSDPRRRQESPLILPPASFRLCGSLDEALEHGPYDAAIYALKSFDTTAAAELMRPVADRMPPVICFSNGVDNETSLAAVLGEGQIIPATVTTAIGRHGPGDIILERLRGVGISSTHPISRRVLECADAAMLNPRAYWNPRAMKWSKMMTNLIANPTSAILDMTAAEVLDDPDIYRLEIAMLRECLAVMRTLGIQLVDLPRTPVKALAMMVRLPIWSSKPLLARVAGAGRGGKMPSFHIDLHSGRGRSEVEYLHGAVARAGAKMGVPTPVNSFLTETLMALTRGEMPREELARQPERLIRAFHAPGRMA